MKHNDLVNLKHSRIHNDGLYAKTDIPAGTAIIQYTGKKLTQKQADDMAEKNEDGPIYLFQLNQRYVIDGDVKNNLAKYINHSCDPNCYPEIKHGAIWIFALRDIQSGEELTYDYGFQRMGWEDHPCRCGKKNCFGFIVAHEHWSSIRKTKRYQRLHKRK